MPFLRASRAVASLWPAASATSCRGRDEGRSALITPRKHQVHILRRRGPALTGVNFDPYPAPSGTPQPVHRASLNGTKEAVIPLSVNSDHLLRKTPDRYGSVATALYWLTAVLILGQIAFVFAGIRHAFRRDGVFARMWVQP
jgi:hypothetical protein